MSTSQDRLAGLERQAGRVEKQMGVLAGLNNQYRMMQLVIFVGGILFGIVILGFVRWLVLPLIVAACIGFYIAGKRQQRMEKSYLDHKFWLQMISVQMARIRLDWAAIPAVPALEIEPEHPFNSDLDISGERSLHQLLNTAVSIEGMQLLLDWLLARIPDLNDIRKRQALVRELVPMTRFRNKLMLNGLLATRFSNGALDGERVMNWLENEQNAIKLPISTLQIAVGLWVMALVALMLYVFVHVSPLFFIAVWALYLIWYFMKKHEQGNLAADTSYLRLAFTQMSTIFEFLEKYPYKKHSQLWALCEPFFLHGDRRPSLLLKKIQRIIQRASWASSGEGWFALNALVPIGPYTAYQLNQQKSLIADYLPKWLDAWYELEALSSLANFAHLNAEYIVPEIVAGKKQEKPAIFRATDLGHPLILKERKVVNDFRLDDQGDVVMITGSNMAGKSTFLRSIGVNLCLAFAGGHVNASSLQTSLFELYGCIKVTDSLADGYSYFYAEVRRLRGLLVEIEEGTVFPLFFLIDEIFKGTNHQERLIGSEAYIRTLVGKRCIGIVSTHDLELVRLADSSSEISNYHFREDVIDGKMVFDYVLRPGPSPTRNALRIMQMEGLPISLDPTPQSSVS